MSVSCIVCLGDLAASSSPSTAERLPSPDSHGVDDGLGVSCEPGSEAASDSVKGKEAQNVSQIARMLPCRHVLHDDCLRPWVERANSCPICRQSFNVVELLDVLDGMSNLFTILLLLLPWIMANLLIQVPWCRHTPSRTKPKKQTSIRPSSWRRSVILALTVNVMTMNTYYCSVKGVILRLTPTALDCSLCRPAHGTVNGVKRDRRMGS